MKKNSTLLILLLFSSALLAQSVAVRLNDIICKETSSHHILNRIAQLTDSSNGDFDMIKYEFHLNLDPNHDSISGSATSFFRSNINSLQVLKYDFAAVLIVDSIVYHSTKITFTQTTPYLLSINLPSAISINTYDSVNIYYHGVPPSNGFGTFTTDEHNGTPIVWTLSEPFGSKDWWPCKNGLKDKIDTIDTYIKTPSRYRAASNGKLIGEITIDTFTTYHWKHQYSIAPYLIGIAVTNYAAYNDTVHLHNGDVMPVVNYVYPESLDDAKIGTHSLVQVLEFFDSLFVTYGFSKEKYGHAQFSWGGGMEHQTMSFVTGFDWSLLSHELGHQWFGDLVTCGSWQDIWLNEGWAQYMEGLSRERFKSNTDWMDWRVGNRAYATEFTSGSVKVSDTTNVGRIFDGHLTYAKGAYLLHMLRWKLGDSIFFRGARNYLEHYKYSFARTPQFKAELEAASGVNLTEFFTQWYEGQGYPSYHITWEKRDDSLTIQINQTTSHPSVSFYKMPVPIKITGLGFDSLLRLENTFNGQVFRLYYPHSINTVLFDPEIKLLSKNNVVDGGIFIGIKTKRNDFAISVYPNPVSSLLDLYIADLSLLKDVNWKIYNSIGEEMISGKIESQSSSINVEKLASGVYFLQIENKEVKNMLKFVKL